MKRLFSIPPKEEKSNDVLLLELSHYHICIATADSDTKNVSALYYYLFENPITADEVREALADVGSNVDAYNRVVVNAAFNDAVIVPLEHFYKEAQYNFLMLPYSKEAVFNDVMDKQGIAVVYSIPPYIMDVLKSAKELSTVHNYCCTLRQDTEADASMAVSFTSKEFTVLVKRMDKLLLAQTYTYTAPMDVIYYLLALCNQYHLQQDTVVVTLFGLVDEDSALYKELHQYFAHLHFAQPPGALLEGHSYPQHFFSSTYNLAACVL